MIDDVLSVARKLRAFQRWSLAMSKIPQFSENPECDPQLFGVFEHWKTIIRSGSIAWGLVLKADSHLFKPSERDGAGIVLFGLSEGISPEKLRLIASRLEMEDESLKAQTIAPQLPDSITEGCPCAVRMTYFLRQELPGNLLNDCFLPIVIGRTPPNPIVPLPKSLWPESFATSWQKPTDEELNSENPAANLSNWVLEPVDIELELQLNPAA